MPEGHTIHRLARDHRRWFAGEQLGADSPQGRAADVAGEIDGRVLEGTDAFGKHLFHRWEGGVSVHIHLGLFGKFRRWKNPPPEPRGAIRLRLHGETHTLSLSGPTACRLIDQEEEEKLLARLGPDPLRADADPELAWESLQRRRIPIAAALMDQAVIAGIGNVYRAEVLNVCRIDPHLPSRELERERFDELWRTVGQMLSDGVRERRIITRREGHDVPMSRVKRAEALWVYRRERCARCGGPVAKEELQARNLWWCPACQRT